MKTLPTIYLCGPINGCSDAECKEWREYVSGLWDGPVLDPMRRDYRGREKESLREIVELDKIDINSCDAMIVNKDRPSDGTSMEILYAFERGKLVVLVVPEGVTPSPWAVYHSHKVVNRFDDAVDYVAEILT